MNNIMMCTTSQTISPFFDFLADMLSDVSRAVKITRTLVPHSLLPNGYSIILRANGNLVNNAPGSRCLLDFRSSMFGERTVTVPRD
ncbi:hypothetical protein OUZ56_008260 [Daphnia magna]|uniref:Uncharacterized protein n=1 Tax=Daphnia magna TaxID=35525 RepID=A0ABR0ACS3_9CRUS|nr:hypothetical protein OUZ56_008260 [Daphnia magna]